MPIRPATASDFDEIASLIRELAAYEKLEREVVFDPAELHSHLFGPDPAASALIAESDDWNSPTIAFYKRIGAEKVQGWSQYRWHLA